MDDKDIVSCYLQRDETAIAHTAEKYGARLQGLAYSLVKDRQTAEEIENDTYATAWASIPPHEPYDYLYPFLARITRHIALNHCRDQQRLKRDAVICELSAEMEECIPSPRDEMCRLDEMALGDAINGFLATLTEEQRFAFLRRYWYAESIADIAKPLACSGGKVKMMLLRLRKRFREYLQQEGYDL